MMSTNKMATVDSLCFKICMLLCTMNVLKRADRKHYLEFSLVEKSLLLLLLPCRLVISILLEKRNVLEKFSFYQF